MKKIVPNEIKSFSRLLTTQEWGGGIGWGCSQWQSAFLHCKTLGLIPSTERKKKPGIVAHAPGRLRQENIDFQGRLDYIGRHCLKKSISNSNSYETFKEQVFSIL
jgi:hypothetical protein